MNIKFKEGLKSWTLILCISWAVIKLPYYVHPTNKLIPVKKLSLLTAYIDRMEEMYFIHISAIFVAYCTEMSAT